MTQNTFYFCIVISFQGNHQKSGKGADGITARHLPYCFLIEVITIDLPPESDKFRMSYDRERSINGTWI